MKLAQLSGRLLATLIVYSQYPIRAVGPLALLFTLWRWSQAPRSSGWRLLKHMWRLWLTSEVWFVFYYLWQCNRLSAPAKPPPMRGDKLSVGRRCLRVTEDIFKAITAGRLQRPRSLDELRDGVQLEGHSLEGLLRLWDNQNPQSMRDLQARAMELERLQQGDATYNLAQAQQIALKRAEVSGWFMGSESSGLGSVESSTLRRGNVEDWMAWAFWGSTPEDIFASDSNGSQRALLDQLVAETAEWAKLELSPGKNPAVQPMRLTLDPVRSLYRPLVFYAVTQLTVMGLTSVAMAWLGFTKHTSGSLKYWHRAADSFECSAATPLVFCHGLGVGVLPYGPLLKKLIASGHTGAIFCVELPHISMRIKSAVPSASELVANIADMMAAWGVAQAHFMGHSFGSVVIAWVTHRRRDLVRRATFIDPVVFLLCKSDVAYNFVYRVPGNKIEAIMQYFVSRELYIAHSLARHFVWHECILWPEDIAYPEGALVVLSGKDSIVPAHSVRRYLEYKQVNGSTDSRLDVCFLAELGHAQFLCKPMEMDAIVERAFAKVE